LHIVCQPSGSAVPKSGLIHYRQAGTARVLRCRCRAVSLMSHGRPHVLIVCRSCLSALHPFPGRRLAVWRRFMRPSLALPRTIAFERVLPPPSRHTKRTWPPPSVRCVFVTLALLLYAVVYPACWCRMSVCSTLYPLRCVFLSPLPECLSLNTSVVSPSSSSSSSSSSFSSLSLSLSLCRSPCCFVKLRACVTLCCTADRMHGQSIVCTLRTSRMTVASGSSRYVG
jgi:hypothetical protein